MGSWVGIESETQAVARKGRNMNRLTGVLVLLLCLVPAITLAQDVGIVTTCIRDANPISNDTVFAALCTGQGAAWNVFTLGYTGLYDNVVVWGVPGINPDVQLPLGNYYQFYAKHPRGGSQGFYYSHWSDTVFYGVSDTFIPVVLDLDTTGYPGDPHW
jgi:hypothetical protein